MNGECDDLPCVHFLPSIYNPLPSDSPNMRQLVGGEASLGSLQTWDRLPACQEFSKIDGLEAYSTASVAVESGCSAKYPRLWNEHIVQLG
jgi:hypothetical protein